MNSLSAGNTHFAFDLFQQLKRSKKDDNIFYSPLSISSALAMTYLGAKENTAFEIGEVGWVSASYTLPSLDRVLCRLVCGRPQICLCSAAGWACAPMTWWAQRCKGHMPSPGVCPIHFLVPRFPLMAEMNSHNCTTNRGKAYREE